MFPFFQPIIMPGCCVINEYLMSNNFVSSVHQCLQHLKNKRIRFFPTDMRAVWGHRVSPSTEVQATWQPYHLITKMIGDR